MQTFITDFNLAISAQHLDDKRLGKQRVETIQIANCLLVKETRWKNHPAVLMWKGYESFLIKKYLKAILQEWTKRGFNNAKCDEHYKRLFALVKNKPAIQPPWLTTDFLIAHQSNLIRKKPDYYAIIFQDIPNNLPYIWPR